MTQQGIHYHEQYLALDPKDTMDVCGEYASKLLEEKRDVKVRQVLHKYKEKVMSSSILAYSNVLLEYISWEILEEEGSTEENVIQAFENAFRLNPFIAVFIAAHKTFVDVVEYVPEIQRPAKSGSIEECFVYAAKNIGLWIDTIGACAWIEKELTRFPMPIATSQHASDEMYLNMYHTAVEMHQESSKE